MVKAGVTWSSLRIVREGYDPTVLPRRAGGLAALTGFVSNEPNQLKAAGYKVTVWQPVKYGIPSSLGAMAVNPAFAQAHPTAVEDVLRAAIHAYDYCSATPAAAAQCVGYTAALSGPAYDTTLNEAIWTTETQVVRANPTPGQPLGGIDRANIGKIVDAAAPVRRPAGQRHGGAGGGLVQRLLRRGDLPPGDPAMAGTVMRSQPGGGDVL